MMDHEEAAVKGGMEDVAERKREITDFRELVGLEIVERRPGYARGRIELKPWHMNTLGIVHGGVFFTMADHVSGTAAVTGHDDYSVPTVSGSINYMRPGKNTRYITAEAHEIKNGRSFSVCECKIFDDDENVLAVTTMTFYHMPVKGK